MFVPGFVQQQLHERRRRDNALSNEELRTILPQQAQEPRNCRPGIPGRQLHHRGSEGRKQRRHILAGRPDHDGLIRYGQSDGASRTAAITPAKKSSHGRAESREIPDVIGERAIEVRAEPKVESPPV